MADPLVLTVHRSAHAIGGNCIELRVGSERLLLDVGRPLDARSDATGLLPATLRLNTEATVLISHPHQDHFGLLNEIPPHWPVMCGVGTERLMRLTADLTGQGIEQPVQTWTSGVAFDVGAFRVTPILTDHSAFDAHMLLIDAAGRRVLYSGDFRLHGRKGALVERLMKAPPEHLDVLLMEGTNIGSDKPTRSEAAVEDDFVDLFRSTAGRVFVAWSAQNVDRTVSVYRACLKAGRTLVVDLYTAEVLAALADLGRLPEPGWKNLKVVVTRAFARLYRRKGREDFVARMAAHGLSAAALAEPRSDWVVMLRPSLIADLEAKGVIPDADDAWSWSQWHGYLEQDAGRRLADWLAPAKARHIHTSGHASTADLAAFAQAMSPGVLVPIHGERWDHEGAVLHPRILRLDDGEPLSLPAMHPPTSGGFREEIAPLPLDDDIIALLRRRAGPPDIVEPPT